MKLYAYGLIWFALYLALAVLPAALAALVDPLETPRSALLEMSVGLGLLAYPLVMMQFALVSHLQGSSRPFGTDALVQFHRYVGGLAVLLALAHAFLLNAAGLPWAAWNPAAGTAVTRTGALAVLALAALLFSTVCRARLHLSHERWQQLHLLLALVAATTMLTHVLQVGGYGSAPPVRYAFLLYAVVFGSTAVHYRLVRPWRMGRRPWVVVENRHETADVRLLRVRPIGHSGFPFDPGQFAWLVTGRSPWSVQQHPLSIASSAERAAGDDIEFAVRASGDWSATVVPALVPGSRVWVDGPFGAFTIDRRIAQGFVLIAGGIGIAPLRAMLQTMRDRGDRRHVLLIYAARDEAHLAFRGELEALRRAMNLDVVFVAESAGAEWDGARGLVTEDLLRRHLPPQFRRYGYFVCGPAAMMDAVEAALGRLGVAGAAIDTERFIMV